MNDSYKIQENLYLVKHTVPTSAVASLATMPTNHVVVVDCSGSMSGELPKIRNQLKTRLKTLLQDGDTVSIVWFSGRGECGVLVEAAPVYNLTDLKAVEEAIDRWLRPCGLTGFKEPLEEVAKLFTRVNNKNPFSLFFMSDGCDNQWSRAEILKAVENAAAGLAASVFVEYGYYADRPMLTAMAEKSGGSLIFAEDFQKYAPQFESVLKTRQTGAKKVKLEIRGEVLYGFAFSLGEDKNLYTYTVEDNCISVPETTKEVWYLTKGIVDRVVDTARSSGCQDAVYAAMSLFSVRMKPEVVLPLLKATGDVKFIDQFSACFGKQKYSEFMEDTKAAAFNHTLRLTKGCNPGKVPDDNAFTILNLLMILAQDEKAALLLDHKDFKYTRIGRARVDVNETLTKDEQAKVNELMELINNEKDSKKIAALSRQISEITNKPGALEFYPDTQDSYSVDGIVVAEERPNISIRVKKQGKVDLTVRDDKPKNLPNLFPTFVYRNYTIVKDGMTNVDKLPVRLGRSNYHTVNNAGAIENVFLYGGDTVDCLVRLSSLPVINRSMVRAVSAKTLFEKEYELTKLRAAAKVYKSFKAELFPERKSETYEKQYGPETALWLKENGITDYSGFSPKSVQAAATDYYMGKEIVVSLKGLSTLPTLKDVKDRMKSGKMTASAELMAPAVKEVQNYCKAGVNEQDIEAWLSYKLKVTTAATRVLMLELAKQKFAIAVGQVWPSEFKSLDENTMKIKVDGKEIEATLEMKEVKVAV